MGSDSTEPDPRDSLPRVVIVGGGFAGLECARRLRRAPVRVEVIDRANHHLFQPLLYQVATAMLSPADIAAPIRRVLRHQPNARVQLGEVEHIDADRRVLTVARVTGQRAQVPYDALVLAAGVRDQYFGHDEWARHAPGLKTVDDALTIRSRFLAAFERAELETDPDARRRHLTFVIVGGGPTGVEMAGAMSEVVRKSIPRDFRSIDTTSARVLLIEAAPKLLGAFPEPLSERALHDLRTLGVEVRLNTMVTDIDEHGVRIAPTNADDPEPERIESTNVIWGAGVNASPLGRQLADATGAETDKMGRVKVAPDLSIPGRPEVFVAGDLAHAIDPKTNQPVPGMAPGALQMGAHIARLLARHAREGTPFHAPAKRPPFRFKDKGTMAVIGRGRAVAAIRGRTFGGLLAWLLWAGVHIFFLIGFRNRVFVMLSWAWSYLTFQRGARLITSQPRRHPETPPAAEPEPVQSIR